MTDLTTGEPSVGLSRMLRRIAYQLRIDVIDMLFHAGSGHPGGSLSAAEIVATLYWHVMRVDASRPEWPGRDRFLMSKGHAAPILYAALGEKGYFDKAHFRTLRHIDSILQGHPSMQKTPGVDMTSGSLGHGLSVGLGMALGARQARSDFQTYVLLSDGELQEGMIWEAAMAAAHHRAGNLTAVVDRNGLQVDGLTKDVLSMDPLGAKWRAFGWKVVEVDGHNIPALLEAFEARRREADSQPWVLICQTIKGKGVSFMENVMEWHSSPITSGLREAALAELTECLEAID